MSRQSAAADEDLSFVFLSFEEKALSLGKDLVLAVEATNGIEALENISMSSQVSEEEGGEFKEKKTLGIVSFCYHGCCCYRGGKRGFDRAYD